MGVNVPNFGPGTAPGLSRRWAQTVEGLGFDLLMISDHILRAGTAARILGWRGHGASHLTMKEIKADD